MLEDRNCSFGYPSDVLLDGAENIKLADRRGCGKTVYKASSLHITDSLSRRLNNVCIVDFKLLGGLFAYKQLIVFGIVPYDVGV